MLEFIKKIIGAQGVNVDQSSASNNIEDGYLIISNGSPSTVASLEEVTDLSKAVLVMPKSTVVKIEEDSESESEDEQDNSMNLSAVD